MNGVRAKLCFRFGIAVFAFGFLYHHAAALPFSNLVVFGDSLSDVGNIAQAPIINTPGPYYWNGRFSNGPVYAELLATELGLPVLNRSSATGGNDFAYGGAKTTGTSFPSSLFVKDIDDQVSTFLDSRTANATTLYVVLAGANDLLGGQTNMSIPVNSLSNSINRLVTAGARQFLVINLPPLGYAPRYNGSPANVTLYNSRSQQFNTTLSTMVDAFEAGNPNLTMYRFGLDTLFTAARSNPAAFGLTNVLNSAAPGLSPGATSYDTSQIVAHPEEYLFWDDLHPTARVHAILGQRLAQMFYAPGDFNHDSKVDAADYVVWRKGTSAGYLKSDVDLWRANFGPEAELNGSTEFGPHSPPAVPEPSAILLILTVIGAVAIRHPRRISAPRRVGSC